MTIPIATAKTPIEGTLNVPIDTPEWANPFDTGDLFEDIISYDEWLHDRLDAYDHPIAAAVDELGLRLLEGETITLVCPCRPDGWYRCCHGQMIVNALKDAITAYRKAQS